ncbi:hypothetical protein F5Y14DRAFT_436186 [Nemania sp. NC0429]|nr:hypothetical protein F5Y14DRAFT_436186 [Nemania sp. NC0429]
MSGAMTQSTLFKDPWFRPELRTKDYYSFGDAYDDERLNTIRDDWKVENPEPYLEYVQKISNNWIHFRLLRDFMEVGTDPQKWKDMHQSSDEKDRPGLPAPNSRPERVQRTKVRVLDYTDGKGVTDIREITCPNLLREHLGQHARRAAAERDFRLYVVEDLSRDVIEVLGHELNIEPDFFRSHIADYAWYNVRDRWRDPPVLDVVGKHRNWVQFRYVTARYFRPGTFNEVHKQTRAFNIKRRVEDDECNTAWWDEKGGGVGLTRSRATYWLSPEHPPESQSRIGVLLLDPTVQAGVPLWRGRRNPRPVPSPREYATDESQNDAEQNAIFNDFVHWASHPEIFRNLVQGETTSGHYLRHAPTQILLHLICSEWLTTLDYLQTRLCQIDMEIRKPESFSTDKGTTATLGKLHTWRRFVPLYREMVGETQRHVSNYSSNITEMNVVRDSDGHTTNSVAVTETAGGSQRVSPPAVTGERLTSLSRVESPGLQRMQQSQSDPISIYEKDLQIISRQLEEYQQRVDQLTSVVTAVMSIEDSRRALTDNQNINRLTLLATTFIPFSLIAGIFSMQTDLSDLLQHHTIQIYVETAIPLSVLIFLLVGVSQNRGIRRRFQSVLLYKRNRNVDSAV